MSEDLMQSTLEEQIFWCDCVRGLPGLEGFSGTGKDKFGENIPWGTGPHSVKAFREAFDIVKPNTVFVIGSNMFYADAVFLNLSNDVTVRSCDISYKDETVEGAKIMAERYKERFSYFNRTETFSLKKGIDLAFVDGSHTTEDVIEDIKLCMMCETKYFLCDDILEQFGGVQKAIDSFDELELVKTWGNIALYINKNI